MHASLHARLDFLRPAIKYFLPLPGTLNPVLLIRRSLIVGVVLTLLSYFAVKLLGLDASLGPLEGAAVLTSYACTYLCIVQSRWNYPLGMISTALYAWLFLLNDPPLLGSAALNIYLVPVLLYGWIRWGKDTRTRPVRHVNLLWTPIYILITAIVWAVCTYIVHFFGGALSGWDTAILVLSVFAQLLLDNKKIETWIVWIAVNVVAIYVYASQGYALVTAQYVLFLMNTVLSYWQWHKSMKATDAVFKRTAEVTGLPEKDVRVATEHAIDTGFVHQQYDLKEKGAL